MNEDELILSVAYILFWSITITMIYKSKNRILAGLTHIPIHILYCSYFIYGLKYDSDGGGSLLWILGLLYTIGIHSLINLLLLFYKLTKSKGWLGAL